MIPTAVRIPDFANLIMYAPLTGCQCDYGTKVASVALAELHRTQL